jgi:hypothetical protein
LVIANKYSTASLMSFYLPGKPVTYVLPADRITNQFAFWPDYKDCENESAIFISDSGELPALLKKQFREVSLISETWSRHRGQRVRKYHLYLCRGFSVVTPGG